jgi:acyl carrier protein
MTRPDMLPLAGRLTRDDFERRLADFVNHALLKSGRDSAVDAETLLFESGAIDSLRILDLLAFIEKTLEVKIPDKAVRLQNFRSIRVIARFFLAEEPHGLA